VLRTLIIVGKIQQALCRGRSRRLRPTGILVSGHRRLSICTSPTGEEIHRSPPPPMWSRGASFTHRCDDIGAPLCCSFGAYFVSCYDVLWAHVYWPMISSVHVLYAFNIEYYNTILFLEMTSDVHDGFSVAVRKNPMRSYT